MRVSLTERLLAPLSPQEFVARYWARCALPLPEGGHRVGRIFENAPLDVVQAGPLRVFQPEREYAAALALGQRPQLTAEGEQLRGALAGGATVLSRDVHNRDSGVRHFLADLKRTLGHGGEVVADAWLSPPGSGVATHFDNTATIVVQLEGAKLWRISQETAMPWPEGLSLLLPDGTAAPDFVQGVPGTHEAWESEIMTPDPSTFASVVLRPGDALFIPAGTWHATEAIGESYSIALNVQLSALRFSRLLNDTVGKDLRSSSAMRGLPACPATGEPVPGALREALLASIARYEAALQALKTPDGLDRLARAWSRCVSESAWKRPPPKITHLPGMAEHTRELHPEDRLRFVGDVPPVTTEREGELTLYVRGGVEEVTFDDPELLAFGHALAAQRLFRAGNATGWSGTGAGYPWEKVKELLETLVASNILERAP